MLHSNTQLNEISLSRMESALLYLVRGLMSRRPHSNVQENTIFESHTRSLLHLITELHRFRDRRNHLAYSEPLSEEVGMHKQKIISEIMHSAKLIREHLIENPIDNHIHMNIVNVKLDDITDYHSHDVVSDYQLDHQLVEHASISSDGEDHTMECEDPTPIKDTEVVMIKTNKIQPDSILFPDEMLDLNLFMADKTFIRKKDLKKKRADQAKLPRVTSFVVAKVGSMVYEKN